MQNQTIPVHIGSSGTVRLRVGNVTFDDGAHCGMLLDQSSLLPT